MVNVGEYTSPMEPMGMWQRLAASIFRQVRHTDEHWHGVALGTDDDGMDTHWPNGILAQIHLEKPQRWHIGRVPKMDKKIGQCSFGGINNNYNYTHSMNVNFCWRKKKSKTWLFLQSEHWNTTPQCNKHYVIFMGINCDKRSQTPPCLNCSWKKNKQFQTTPGRYLKYPKII